MSNNAVEAYENGEMPLSKWNRQAFINYYDNDDSELRDAINERAKDNEYWYNQKRKTNPNYSLDNAVTDYKNALGKSNTSWLKSRGLNQNGWHHTSKFYNETNFYSPDTSTIANYSPDDLAKQRIEKSPEQIEHEKFQEKQHQAFVNARAQTDGFFDRSNNPTPKLINAYHMMGVPYDEYAGDKYDAVSRINVYNNPYQTDKTGTAKIVNDTKKAIKLGQPPTKKQIDYINANRKYVEHTLGDKIQSYRAKNDVYINAPQNALTDDEYKTYTKYYNTKRRVAERNGNTPQKALNALDEINAHSIRNKNSTRADMQRVTHLKQYI